MTKSLLQLIILILTLLLHESGCQKISAKLVIITYQPLYLNLTFTSPLALPKFQLLFNEIPIKYKVLSSTSPSSFYLIQGITQNIINPSDFKTEKYVLLFREPLRIAEGKLNLDSFILRAERVKYLGYEVGHNQYKTTPGYPHQIQSNSTNILAITICSIIYFLAYTTVIGIHAYNFISIYIFICLQTQLFTALDFRMANLFLLQAHLVIDKEMNQFIYMLIPHILILASLLVGLITRVALGQNFANQSKLRNLIYYYLTYRLFIITYEIMCVPIFANIKHLFYNPQHFTTIGSWVINLYIYFSFILLFWYSYMAYFLINPQIGQKTQKWLQYIKTPHFKLFQGFHLNIDSKDWKKRNFSFLVSIIRLLIVIFVACNFINVPNLLLQICYLIYLFTLCPFKYNFFNQFIIGIQIAVISLYLYRYVTQLYLSISDHIITSSDMEKILFSNIIILCVITFTYFVLGSYEFYSRLRTFKAGVIMEIKKKDIEEPTTLNTNRSAEPLMKQEHRHRRKKSIRKKKTFESDLSSPNQFSPTKLKDPRLKNILKQSKQSIQFGQLPSPEKKMNKSGSPMLSKSSANIGSSIKKSDNNSKNLSLSSSSPKEKTPRKNKEKSSLLQTISMAQETS